MVKRTPKFTPREQDKVKLSKLNTSIRRKERRLNLEFGKSMNIEVKHLQDFNTRKEFNRYIEQGTFNVHRNQHRYVKNQHGIVISRRQYNQFQRDDNKYQRKSKRELERIRRKKMRSQGQETDYTVGDFDRPTTMGRENLGHLKYPKFDFDVIANMQEFEKKRRVLAQRADPKWLELKNKQFKENYLKAIREVYGAGGDRPIGKDEVGHELHEFIDNMSIDDFMETYLTEFDMSIGFLYAGAEKQAKLDRLHDMFGIELVDWSEHGEDDDVYGGQDYSEYW